MPIYKDMLKWLKNLFRKHQSIKKDVGDLEVSNRIVLGPIFFSKDGKQSNALLGPPIMAFNYGITNAVNRLNHTVLQLDEFQAEFNSLWKNFVNLP